MVKAPGQDDTVGLRLGRKVPAGTRVYAIGDIHGRIDLLERMIGLIQADAAAAPANRQVLVHLGDYVDRGPDSAKVVSCLTERTPTGFEAIFLKGNHEDLLVRFMEWGLGGESWLLNGGTETLSSYGIDMPPFPSATELVDCQRRMLAVLPSRHKSFFRNLAMSHREGDYLFVHAGIRPGVAWAEQRATDLLWIREEFLFAEEDHGCCVVHGHTVVQSPIATDRQIAVDTGAFKSGVLTCAVLACDRVSFLQT